jgi:hypothetical protein
LAVEIEGRRDTYVTITLQVLPGTASFLPLRCIGIEAAAATVQDAG